MSLDALILIGSLLVYVSILVGKASSRFGVPVLLLFLLVGFVAGDDMLGVISFNSPVLARGIGVIALCIILFSGGMDTRIREIRPVLLPGLLLATLGVLLTALFCGIFIYFITKSFVHSFTFSLSAALLLAGVMASTDSASVFSILRSHNLSLKQNLRPLLELESGSNDPMASLLTIVMIQIIKSDISAGHVIWMFISQMAMGLICGLILGRLAQYIINRINLENDALYSVLLLTIMFFVYGFTGFVGGNGFLAVYLSGLFLGNRRFVHKRSSTRFFEGLTWLAQIVMFLSLGLLVSPKEMLSVTGIGLAIGLFLIMVARPLAVFICLTPFKEFDRRGRLFAAFVGLRGASPIVFATYPLLYGVPLAQEMFNIVFFITLLSLLVQGTLIPTVAHKLDLALPEAPKQKLKEFDVDISDETKSVMSELTVTPRMLIDGSRLMDIDLPDHALIAMVKRTSKKGRPNYFIPRGNAVLELGDKLLILTDSEEAMMETRQRFGQ